MSRITDEMNTLLQEIAEIVIKGVKNDNKKDRLINIILNKKFTDDDLQDFSKTFIAEMLMGFLKRFKCADIKDEKFDADQLAKGVAVEQEHTDDSYIAKIIAKAHLNEFPTYYNALEKMENELKQSKKD